MSIQDIAENLSQMQIGLDDTFRFHCTMCGKCCEDREDILLSPRDLYRISKELHMTPVDFYHRYCESYIGENSRIPIIRLKPVGNAKRCPMLQKRKCRVHNAKPSVCALYPLGRFMEVNKKNTEKNPTVPEVKYLLQPVDCGDEKEEHTVRQWLHDFDISLEDRAYIRWNSVIMHAGPRLKSAEDQINPVLMYRLYAAFMAVIYLNYDTEQDFLPQFETNAEKIGKLLNMFNKGD